MSSVLGRDELDDDDATLARLAARAALRSVSSWRFFGSSVTYNIQRKHLTSVILPLL